VVLGQVVFPLVMMMIYLISGYYNDIFRKSRVQEFLTTLYTTFINTLIIFFVALINDMIYGARIYNYELFFLLWGVLFFIIYPVRVIITNFANKNIHKRKWQFNTLIIGAGPKAIEFEEQLRKMKDSLGYNIVGYVGIPGESQCDIKNLNVYDISELTDVCVKENISELIVIPSTKEMPLILNAINKLYILNLPIKISPDMYNILLGKMRLANICGEPLIDISGSNMTACERNIKRLMDLFVSGFALLILSPIFVIVSIMIKKDSEGPVFYSQKRVGYRNKLFTIYKFRTMVKDAEKDGIPELATDGDTRVTAIGRFLRKYRIDEFPQFYNVFMGEMSLVGPRPEREFYVNQIVKIAPFYSLLHQVRPGITSMGMVKYGYATSIDEMVDRLKYDLLYLENMSIANDIKIMIYTIKTVCTGKGL